MESSAVKNAPSITTGQAYKSDKAGSNCLCRLKLKFSLPGPSERMNNLIALAPFFGDLRRAASIVLWSLLPGRCAGAVFLVPVSPAPEQIKKNWIDFGFSAASQPAAYLDFFDRLEQERQKNVHFWRRRIIWRHFCCGVFATFTLIAARRFGSFCLE